MFRRLDLSGQNLTELPRWLLHYDEILELDLSKNQIRMLPSWIGTLHQLTFLNIGWNNITELPESIGQLKKLEVLIVNCNPLNKLPESIGNLAYLKRLQLNACQLTYLPESIANLKKLNQLDLRNNNLAVITPNINRLSQLVQLNLRNNKLTSLTGSIDRLRKLNDLDLSENQIAELPKQITELVNLSKLKIDGFTKLPKKLGNLINLRQLSLSGTNLQLLPDNIDCFVSLRVIDLHRNPINNLSKIQHWPLLETVCIFRIHLPRRYWTNFCEWKAEWLFDETNAEIRRRLIEQVGYERICDELGAIEIETWQKYTLLKIDNIEIVDRGLRREPMVLLKMTCPSTAHIHILRVPPDMTRAEDAIVWVNHGIHPSKFAVQT